MPEKGPIITFFDDNCHRVIIFFMRDITLRKLIARGRSLLITLPLDCLIILGLDAGDPAWCYVESNNAMLSAAPLAGMGIGYRRKLFQIAGSSTGIVLPSQHLLRLEWLRGMTVRVEPVTDGLVRVQAARVQPRDVDAWEPGDEARAILRELDAETGG